MADSKNALDLFGLTDIDKIQAEIERDLTGAGPAMPEASKSPEIFEPPEVQEAIGYVVSPDYSPPEDLFALLPPDSSGFYRETIKDAPRKRPWAKTAVALLLICTLGTGTLGFGLGAGWGYFRERTGADGEAIADAQAVPLAGAQYVFEPVTSEVAVSSIADMVELILPAVVGITTHRDNAFPPTSAGTGIIFAENEERIFIATNHYVVRGGNRVEVSINGSEPLLASAGGGSPVADLAILSIAKSQLAAAGVDPVGIASFGDSTQMRIGDRVFAIGNAMGDGTSVTSGVISAPKMSIRLPNWYDPVDVLRTDAAINYGNSGGPLINARGEIVGINTNQATGAIMGPSNVEGMGYSVSSNVAAPILEDLVAGYRRPALGISGISLADDSRNMADYWGIPELGVLVDAVMEGEAACRAGILPHDVITGFNGLPIFEMRQLQEALRACQVGDIVEVNILRGGTIAITLQAELREMIHVF